MRWVSILSLLLLPACSIYECDSYQDGMNVFERPLFLRGLPQGDHPYAIGFRDGCRQQIGDSGNVQQRMIDDVSIPPALATNQLYRDGYGNGSAHCGVYVNGAIIL